MPSSTSRLESSDRRTTGRLIAIVIAAPLAVLVLLQANYVLSYAACADRSNAWVHTPTGVAIGVLVLTAISGSIAWRRVSGSAPPRAFIGRLAVLGVFLSLLVALAFTLGPLILNPCDF